MCVCMYGDARQGNKEYSVNEGKDNREGYYQTSIQVNNVSFHYLTNRQSVATTTTT